MIPTIETAKVRILLLNRSSLVNLTVAAKRMNAIMYP